MAGTSPHQRGTRPYRVFCALWLAAFGIEALAYRILESSDAAPARGVAGVVGVLAFFLGPFLLAAYTLVAMRRRFIESPSATLAAMAVGVAVVGLAGLAAPGAGSAITNVGFLLLLIAGLGPWFLGLFGLAWLLARWRRGLRPRGGGGGSPSSD